VGPGRLVQAIRGSGKLPARQRVEGKGERVHPLLRGLGPAGVPERAGEEEDLPAHGGCRGEVGRVPSASTEGEDRVREGRGRARAPQGSERLADGSELLFGGGLGLRARGERLEGPQGREPRTLEGGEETRVGDEEVVEARCEEAVSRPPEVDRLREEWVGLEGAELGRRVERRDLLERSRPPDGARVGIRDGDGRPPVGVVDRHDEQGSRFGPPGVRREPDQVGLEPPEGDPLPEVGERLGRSRREEEPRGQEPEQMTCAEEARERAAQSLQDLLVRPGRGAGELVVRPEVRDEDGGAERGDRLGELKEALGRGVAGAPGVQDVGPLGPEGARERVGQPTRIRVDRPRPDPERGRVPEARHPQALRARGEAQRGTGETVPENREAASDRRAGLQPVHPPRVERDPIEEELDGKSLEGAEPDSRPDRGLGEADQAEAEEEALEDSAPAHTPRRTQ
jgi:hypothetical protein